MDIWFLDGKRLEPKELLWTQPKGVDAFYSIFTTFQLQYYDVTTDLICIIKKRQYL